MNLPNASLTMEPPTPSLLSCRSNVGPLRFPSTSTRCTTLCWRTEPAQTPNTSASSWAQTAAFYRRPPAASCQTQETQTATTYFTAPGQLPCVAWALGFLRFGRQRHFSVLILCLGSLVFRPHHGVLMSDLSHDFERQGCFTSVVGSDWILL